MTRDPSLYSIGEYRRKFERFSVETWAAGNGTASADQVRFNYLHATQFFPHALIPRSGRIKVLDYAIEPKFEEVCTDTPLGSLTFSRFFEESGMDAALVIWRGRIALEKYADMRAVDCHIWWSVSKAIASLLVAMLQDRRLVDVHRHVEYYIPELKNSGFAGVTVLDVLDMASGIDALEADDPRSHSDPRSAFGRFEGSLGIQPRTEGTPASAYRYVSQLQQMREPGRAFEYTSVNTFVLGWLIEVLTDAPLHEVIRGEIWGRIGAENDAVMMVAPATGAPAIHGGISSTLRDLGRFGLLFTPSHRVACDDPLVSEEMLNRIQTGGRPEIFGKASVGTRVTEMLGEAPSHNTYQWDFVMPDGDFFKGGFDGQGLYISADQDLVVAYFGHKTTATYALKYARKIASLCRGAACTR